ncbi:hypothetical protein OROMI_016669 [Orobanche minor]
MFVDKIGFLHPLENCVRTIEFGDCDDIIYRVYDMELVRILPSAKDEINVACFHPLVGSGLVYGTNEGKLRIFQCDLSHGFNNEGSCVPDDNMLEVPTYALEG